MSDDTRVAGGSFNGSHANSNLIAAHVGRATNSRGVIECTNEAGMVDHSASLSQCIADLFESPSFSDLTLVVEGEVFPVHKVVLAVRSEYFRALLYGGLAESCPGRDRVELRDLNPVAFRLLLRYLYTGRLALLDLKEDTVLDLLGLAHQYNFTQLEAALSDYLKMVLCCANVCMIYDIACIYGLQSLCESCLEFIDQNAPRLLESDTFYNLSKLAIEAVISRDSFCSAEIDIFRAVCRWIAANCAATSDSAAASAATSQFQSVMSCVRLPLMTIAELLYQVRASDLVTADDILDAIRIKTESRDSELPYRGILLPEENVATALFGSSVTRGECKSVLLDGDVVNYDLDRGFCRHPIDDGHGMLVVKLGQACILNTLRLLLWDRDMRSYSYYIETSMDEEDWVRVVDYRQYLCRSWQLLHFEARVVRFIKIVGTHNTVNRVFHAVSLEAFYTRVPFRLELGVVIPDYNVATVEHSACVVEGVSRLRNALINRDTRNYDWDSGYTCHQLGNGSIVVQLAQPYVIDSMRLLLWDCDERSYSYTVEVSTDQQRWRMVCDRSTQQCKSWQVIVFEPLPVIFVRIVGTHNTANEVFHVVHFECPCEADALSAYLSENPQEMAAIDRMHCRLQAVNQVPTATVSSSRSLLKRSNSAVNQRLGTTFNAHVGSTEVAAAVVVRDAVDSPPQWATARPH